MSVPATIERYLSQHGCAYTAIHHPRAYTAQQEAAVTHTPGRHWAKTVVCIADDEPVLVVMGADRRLDLEALRRVAGARELRMAAEHELARFYADCEVGAMPPFGPMFHQRVFVDRDLTGQHDITFHAGTHADGIRMTYNEYARLVLPEVGEFTTHV